MSSRCGKHLKTELLVTFASNIRLESVNNNIVSFLGITEKKMDIVFKSDGDLVINIPDKKHNDYLALKNTAI